MLNNEGFDQPIFNINSLKTYFENLKPEKLEAKTKSKNNNNEELNLSDKNKVNKTNTQIESNKKNKQPNTDASCYKETKNKEANFENSNRLTARTSEKNNDSYPLFKKEEVNRQGNIHAEIPQRKESLVSITDSVTEKTIETVSIKELKKDCNNLANTDFSKSLHNFIKILLMAKYSCVKIYEERCLHECENLITLLTEIEDLTLKKLTVTDFRQAQVVKIHDLHLLDLESQLCDFHVEFLKFRSIFSKIIKHDLNDERLCELFDQINILISRIVALKQSFCYEEFNKTTLEAIEKKGEPKVRILEDNNFITIGDFYKKNQVSKDFKNFMKSVLKDTRYEFINRRKNEINSDLLNTVDTMFTKKKDQDTILKHILSQFEDLDKCYFDTQAQVLEEMSNKNNSNNRNDDLLEQSAISFGSSRIKKLIHEHLCGNDSVSINQSYSTYSFSSKNEALKRCAPIDCKINNYAQALNSIKIPDFMKNDKPSISLVEIKDEKVSILTRNNKISKQGSHQFFAYKYDLNKKN